MKRNFYLLICVVLQLFFGTTLQSEESVVLAEGKVSVFEYIYKKGHPKVITAPFIKLIDNNVILVTINRKSTRSFISSDHLNSYESRLISGVYLLLSRNYRKKFDTHWDVIALEKPLSEGERYMRGIISTMPASIREKMLNQAARIIKAWQDSLSDQFFLLLSDTSLAGTRQNETFENFDHFSGFSSTIGLDTTARPEFEDSLPVISSDELEEQNTAETNPVTSPSEQSEEIPEETGSGFYVNAITGNDSWSGTEAHPFKTVTHAMNLANGTEATTIQLANGTYDTANGEVFPISCINNVTIKGESLNAIIDGGGAVTLFNASGINSFTINTLTLQDASVGLNISSSNVTIENSTFQNFIDGGVGNNRVIYLDDAHINVNNTTFDNIIGGIYSSNAATSSTIFVEHSEFSNSSANSIQLTNGGNTLTILDSAFHDGWAVYCFPELGGSANTVNITRSVFYGNIPNTVNGGVYLRESDCSISNTVFHDTSGSVNLSSLYIKDATNATVYNSTFDDNSNMTAIYLWDSTNTLIKNCSFSNNRYGIVLLGTSNPNTTMVSHNLFFNHSQAHLRDSDAPGTNYNSQADITAAPFSAGSDNNLFLDPQYKDAAGDDYRPSQPSGSPLIDAGIDDGNLPGVDYQNQPRIYNGLVDIGAFEYQGNPADPIVSGKVYDFDSGDLIENAIVGIYKKGENSPLQVKKTSSNGTFSFNVLPGIYALAVKKNGYYFPSTKINGTTFGNAKGEYFQVYDGIDVIVDIPLDPQNYLTLTKTANKKQLTTGEIVTVNCEISNSYILQSIDQVILNDTVPNGFKYIQNSALLGRQQCSDPNINGKHLSFNVGSIAKRQKLNLSYQMVVSTGAPCGEVFGEAVCLQRDYEISEKSSVSFEVILDPLFYAGTIMGRIICDEEGKTNEETQMQLEDINLKGIELATEYGLRVKTDTDGMFHIPKVPPGRHTLKLRVENYELTINNEQYIIVPDKNPKLIEVTEGGITKCNFNVKIVKKSDSIHEIRNSDFFVSALGEIEFRKNKITGNDKILKQDDDFKEGNSLTGRGAVYVDGEVKGFKISGSIDTERRTNKNKTFRENRYFTRLDPREYFPDYGDESEINFSNDETLDMLSLSIERDGSYFHWGSLNIDYPHYRRVFHGGEIEYKGKILVNNFSQTEETIMDKTKVNMFWAGTDHRVAYEEHNGTGGSVYYLKHNNIIEGTEKLTVLVREPMTKRILTEIYLHPDEYVIHYVQGRIVLNKALPSYLYSPNVLQNNINPGDQVVLVVYYEYKNPLPLDRAAFGGRVSTWIGKHVQTSFQFTEEERADTPYQFTLGETLFHMDDENWFKVQYGKSKESFQALQSFDGGLSFSEVKGSTKDFGAMFLFEGKMKILESIRLYGIYSSQDPGFSSLSASKAYGQTKYFTEVKYDLFDNATLLFSHFSQKTEKDSPFSKDHETTEIMEISKLQAEWAPGNFDLKLEYQAQDLTNIPHSIWILGDVTPRSKELFGGSLGFRFDRWMRIYGGAQITVSGLENDQYFAGSNISFWDNTSVSIEKRWGEIGDATVLGLSHRDSSNSESSLSLIQSRPYFGNNSMTLDFSRLKEGPENSRVTFANRFSSIGNRCESTQSVISDKILSTIFQWGAGYEETLLEEDKITSSISRKSAHISYQLKATPVHYYGKAEWRKDTINEEDLTEAWYFEQDVKWKTNMGLTLSGRGGLGYAENPKTNSKRFDFTDSFLGFAYRPVDMHSINLIGKYVYLTDLFPESRAIDFNEETEFKKEICSIAFTWDPFAFIQLSQSYSERKMHEKTGRRNWIDSKTSLWINGLTWQFYRSLKLKLEYRILENTTFHDSKQGAYAELLIPFKDLVYIGTGYNFCSFDDDLSNEDDYDEKGAFIRLTAIY